MALFINELAMYDLTCLVVLYNKEMVGSITLQSLLSSGFLNDKKKRLVVWNNGPKRIKKEDVCAEFDFIETLGNISLGEIYNRFIGLVESKKYMILDDDSLLSLNIFDYIVNSKADIILPYVKVDNEYIFPVDAHKGELVSLKSENINMNYLMSIGSGVCISHNLVGILKNKFYDVFDSRFMLYGVDSTFFYRLRSIKNLRLEINGEIIHSMSRFDNETSERSKFRNFERCYDLALQNRFYCSWKSLKATVKFISKMMFHFQFSVVFAFFRCYVSARHPRNYK